MSDLNACGCCEKTPSLETISNRPGLTALEYRIGVYGSFLKRLLDGIHSVQVPTGPNAGAQPLTALTTRSSDDPSIALLDAWAVVADVLTFYQERIANEGYLRTATERRSILELAREIGYELAPGVAANILLQFTVENIIGVPVPGTPGLANTAFNSGKVLIPKGTQVQSIPATNQTPQLFETSADFEARVERNQMLPRLERPADLAICNSKIYLLGTRTSFRKNSGVVQLPATQVYLLNPDTPLDPSLSLIPAVQMNQIYLQGTNTNVKVGDRVLLVGFRGTTAKTQSFVVHDVETDSTMNRTAVIFAGSGGGFIPSFEQFAFPAAAVGSQKIAFTKDNVAAQILDTNISESDLDAFLQENGWDPAQLAALVNAGSEDPASSYGAFAMRATCGFFGHNAPVWKTLPDSAKLANGAYPHDWDTANKGRGQFIWTDSQGNPYPDADAFLERTFPQVLPNSWVLFESPAAGDATYQVDRVVERSLADYGFSGRSTGLRLKLQAQVRGVGMGSPTIVAGAMNSVDVFAVGFDGHLYHRWLDNKNHWQGPKDIGGTDLVDAPSAVSWGPNRIDIFAIDSDKNLQHFWTDGNNVFQGPEPRGGGNLINTPVAVSRGVNSLDVCATGSDGNLYHFFWDGQNWNGPDSWGNGSVANSPAVIPAGVGLVIFVVGSDGNLYQMVWLEPGNQVILPLQALIGVIVGGLVDSPSAVYLPILNAFYIAVRCSNGPIFLYTLETYLGQQYGFWQPVAILDEQFTGSPLAIVSSPASIEILGVGSDGNLHGLSWVVSDVPFEIYATKSLGGDGNLQRSPAAAIQTAGTIDIAAVGASGHWYYSSGDSTDPGALTDLGNGNMVPFPVRNTTAYVQSEQLLLAGVPVVDDIPAGTEKIMLNSLMLGLAAGQPVALNGMRSDAPAVAATEMLTIHDVVHQGGFTAITFRPKLQYSYQRSSVTIGANVTAATNGATVSEVLGNGDGAQTNQSFNLKRPPLTFVSASTPTGTAGTLEVRVNDVPWTQVPTLYGRNSRNQDYTVRLADDGTPAIGFGEPAARLKSGQQNVRATYRTGIGVGGNVDAGSVSILMSRPPGLRGVTNPWPATGGADPQPVDGARDNAPLTVLTLDRIVSLTDYENFAKAFTGVGKAQAIALWNGETRVANLTVADSKGQSIPKSLYTTLSGAIARYHDPLQTFILAGYQPLSFNLSVAVLVNEPTYDRDTVQAAVATALVNAFSFEKRAFGQAVTESEIVALIQSVPGVIASNLTQLYLAGDPQGPFQSEPLPFLPAAPARWDQGAIQLAQLLLLKPTGITITEMPR